MAKNSSDQFSKQLLEEILAPFGTVEISHEVLGESQLVDVYFVPNLQSEPMPESLGLLGQIAQTPCLIEPFRNQPTAIEIRSCLLKLFQVHGNYQRQARRESQSLLEADLPQLWILASSASQTLLEGFGASSASAWVSGVYGFPTSFKTAIVAINQLPSTPETLWLRLLGKGKTQQGAIAEVMALDARDARRSTILRILANWKITLEITGQAEAEQELLMALSQAYLEWEQRTEQRGRQAGLEQGERSLILRLLTRRFGTLPEELSTQVQALTLSQLEALGDALLDFSELTDLVNWLRSPTQD